MKEATRDDSIATGGFALCWFSTHKDGRQPFEILLPTYIAAAVEEEVQHSAAQARDRERALLAAGANASLKDNRGKTAADIAREQGFSETVAALQK